MKIKEQKVLREKKISLFELLKRPRYLLPALMSKLTGEKRYLPKTLNFNWSGNVVNSLLMCYYAVFWRRWGIRPGGLAWYQDTLGHRKVWVTTKFGALLFLEHEIIRPILRWKPKWKQVHIFVPAFATFDPYGFSRQLRSPFLFAIAYEEGEGETSGTGTSLTLSNVEGSGTDPFLVTSSNHALNDVSSVTHNSVGMTQIDITRDSADGNPFISTYGLINPTTSATNLVWNYTSSQFSKIIAQTYSGVNQTTATANATGGAGTNGSVTPVSVTLTSDIDGSWAFIAMKEDTAGELTAGTGTTRRQTDATPFDFAMFDGATAVANTATHTLNVNWAAGGQKQGHNACMIRAAAITLFTVDVSDSITITELITIQTISSISVSDTLNITESVTINNTQLGGISVSDDVSITESITVGVINNINVSDDINITEDLSVGVVLVLSVSDQINITEDITISNPTLEGINVSDDISITESVTSIATIADIDVSDSIDITESIATEIFNLINVSDQINITESISVPALETPGIDVSDDISITESTTLTLPLPGINVSDSITITENVENTGSSTINVSDQINITETNTIVVRNDPAGFIMMRSDQQTRPLGMDDLSIL